MSASEDWAEDVRECREPSVASELLMTLAALWVGEDLVPSLLLVIEAAPGEETSCGNGFKWVYGNKRSSRNNY